MTVSELKPCPFCGERAELKTGIHTQYVICLSCETMGPNLASPSECVAAWNRRALTAALSDQAVVPTWNEDELALAFFDYSACIKARCTFDKTKPCPCATEAYKAVH